MTYWRYILHSLLMLVLVSGTAEAENDIPLVIDSRVLVAGLSARDDNNNLMIASKTYHSLFQVYDLEKSAGTCSDTVIDPAGCFCGAIAGASLVAEEMEVALIEDEALDRISGGANLFTAPDVVSQRVCAIKLWDEGKSKGSVSYLQGSGKIISTILVERR